MDRYGVTESGQAFVDCCEKESSECFFDWQVSAAGQVPVPAENPGCFVWEKSKRIFGVRHD